MLNRDTLRDMLHRQPFEPIEFRTTDGSMHWVRHPEFVLLQESGLILAEQGSDRFVIIPYSQISLVSSWQKSES